MPRFITPNKGEHKMKICDHFAMNMRFPHGAMLVGGSAAIAAIAVGFTLEKLFFEQWPWWAWAAIAIFSGLVALLVSRLIPQLEHRQADLPAEANSDSNA